MKETLKSHKPNIGLINPPFSQKGDNLKELSYIINILDSLEKGGRCVAILPLNCINTDTNLKREILNQHTLLASLSMPNQLFLISPPLIIDLALVFIGFSLVFFVCVNHSCYSFNILTWSFLAVFDSHKAHESHSHKTCYNKCYSQPS